MNSTRNHSPEPARPTAAGSGKPQPPLGTPLPDSPHAICSSLPHLDDVIGYEEKRPETLQKLKQGYPRFLQHPWIKQIREHLAGCFNINASRIHPVASERAAEEINRIFSYGVRAEHHDGLNFLKLPQDAPDEAPQEIASFLQHTGYLVSTREAEDWLVQQEHLEKHFPEETMESGSGAQNLVKSELRARSPQAGDLFLTRTGMTAGYAALCGATQLQARKGRNVWVQLGWLYLDTQRILERLLPENGEVVKIRDVHDLQALRQQVADVGDRLAGLITEVPTNPLVRVPDIEPIAETVHQHGGLCVYDPTLVSLANVDALPYADIQVLSLTKYASWRGDVIAGAVMLNQEREAHDELSAWIQAYIEPPYERDLRRLAHHMQDWYQQVQLMNANALQLGEWLEQQKGIKRVHWAHDADSRTIYHRLAGSKETPGAILSLELAGDPRAFYDAIEVAKGPSFGTSFSLLCPFLYLAHYDLVSDPAGRQTLHRNGIDPELLRFSCGTEPIDELKAIFSDALHQSF